MTTPHIRTGQGTSTQNVWLDGGFWHEAHLPPDTCRTIRVWLRGEDSPRTGYSYAGLWVVYDDADLPVHIDRDFVIGWQDIPAATKQQPAPSHDWPLMAGVGAGVVAIMLASWLWSPLIGAGAAALAVVFAVACWVGGDK